MNQIKKDEIKNNLSKTLEKYIKGIIDMYGSYIPKERLDFLENIKDFSSIIKIYDYGSINAYANDKEISMPLCADKILSKASKIPGFGINKNHQSYNKKQITNNNTFIHYLYHVFVSGTTTEKYYDDMLLHETMHFCGVDGRTALKEGITELLTRKTALEKDFKTNGCGYPKEVKIAFELQQIFSEDILNQIAFLKNEKEIYFYLTNTLGLEEAMLYIKISNEMEKEFNDKYYSNMDTYNGITGIFKKTYNYSKIDYTNVYKMLEDYTSNIKEKHIKK